MISRAISVGVVVLFAITASSSPAIAQSARQTSATLASPAPFMDWQALALMAFVLGGAAAWLVFSFLPSIGSYGRDRFHKVAMNNLPQGLIMFDADERIVVVNRALLDMYELSEDVVAPGVSFIEYLEHRASTGLLLRDPYSYREEIVSRISENSIHSTTGRTADGRSVSIVEKGLPGGGWIVTHEDISERARLESELSFMARHDTLTKLPNRACLRERVQEILQERRVDDHGWAIHMLDLDRFKLINDTLGHPIGDRLLKKVARRLTDAVREDDVVARLGGDEFVVLQALQQDEYDAETLARRLVKALEAPFNIAGHECRIGTSIGIALAPKDGRDFDELLKSADLALYRSKDEGRGTYHFFEPALDERMRAKRRMEIEMRKALAAQEFELYYQPLVNLEADKICTFEALLRWNKEGFGQIQPADFIPLAEETGLIVDIGEWVLETACLEAMAWPNSIGVAVNVSAVQFRNEGFYETVKNALERSGLEPSRLELEITESVLIDDDSYASDILPKLRQLGVRLALDDFGTGYSSLSTLRQHKFHKIKIDRSFVKDIQSSDAEADTIVRTIINLGLSMGLTTTAEGVENVRQVSQVREMGCTEIQGYLISTPRPASELNGLIEVVDQRREAAA